MKYQQYVQSKAKEGAGSADQFASCKKFIMQTQIQCFKYNTSLDKAVQK
jgi:hypothetical protein